MKIAIASGKGGVGKSMLASVLCMLFVKSKEVTAVDCDVDAPNLHLWLGEDEKWDRTEKISVSEKPIINFEKCTGCGICEKFCPEGCIVIKEVKGFKGRKSVIDYDYCKGCLICMAECPFKAIDKEVESK